MIKLGRKGAFIYLKIGSVVHSQFGRNSPGSRSFSVACSFDSFVVPISTVMSTIHPLRPLLLLVAALALASANAQTEPAVPEGGEQKTPFAGATPAKQEPTHTSKPVTVADEKPVYAGGDAGLARELAKRLKYPKEAAEAGMQGTVLIQYVIGTDGAIGDIKVIKGLFTPMDKAAVAALKAVPPYQKPARIAGQPVPYQTTIPVLFRTAL